TINSISIWREKMRCLSLSRRSMGWRQRCPLSHPHKDRNGMLNITYAEQDAGLATTIQKDVSASGLTLEHPYLLVLLSRLTLNDTGVQSVIRKALQEKQRVVPVLVESGASLPAEL